MSMVGFRGRAAWAVLVLPLLAASALAQTAPSSPSKWAPYIDFDGKAGTKRNLGEADVFVPVWQDNATLLFGDVRTRLDDHESREGNIGLGIRHMLDSGWNLGAYGFFDRRRSENQNFYSQVTLGAEALSLDWDFRANVYVPEGRRQHDVNSLNTADLSGTTVVFRDGEEKSLRGFDGEIGWRVPIWSGDAPQQLRVYAGAYRFYADSVPAVQGPRGRIDLTIDEMPHLWPGARLELGTTVQNDGPRGTQAFAEARLRIPLEIFGKASSSLTPMERRMTDPVVRDVDIVSQAGNFGAQETATQLANGNTLTVINSSSTSGANLATAVSNAGANANIILAGTFNTGATQTAMVGGQTLMAGSIGVRSASGRTATLVTSATISGSNVTGGNALLQPTDNTTVQGLTIQLTDTSANGGIGIQPNNTAGNIKILNNTVTVSKSNTNATLGISLSANTNVTVSGNTVTVTGAAGQTARALSVTAASTATVTANTLSASGGGTNNSAFVQAGNTINAGSTANVQTAGTCSNSGTGTISFTDGSHCP